MFFAAIEVGSGARWLQIARTRKAACEHRRLPHSALNFPTLDD
jgi:hypothetical protein